MKTKFFKRSASFLLALIIFATCLPIPDFQASAHEAAVIKTYVDADNMSFQTTVDYEDSGTFGFAGHEGSKLLSVSLGRGTSTNAKILGTGADSTADENWSAYIKPSASGNRLSNAFGGATSNGSLVLGWPTYTGDATPNDMKRATLVGTTLTKSLNSIVQFYSGGGKSKDPAQNISTLQEIMYKVDPAVIDTEIAHRTHSKETGYVKISLSSGEGYNTTDEIYYATGKRKEINIGGTLLDAHDDDGNLYCYLVKSGTTVKTLRDVSSVIWAMPKGTKSFKLDDGTEIVASLDETDQDVDYVTVFMLAQQAIQAIYKDDNYISATKTPEIEEANFFVKIIYRFFDLIFSGLRSLLGLYEIDELIFNQGAHGSSLYEDGLMHTTWWNVVLKYYTIVQLIAWMAIALAIAKTLISINMGTISANPRQRKELMDNIVELFTVGMLLTLCIPIVRLMVQLNNGLVNVFAAGYSGNMAQSPNVPNLLVGLIMEIFMFTMTFYANFIYIIRSITIAILVAMGPICIVSMSFSKERGKIFDKWLQELTANIFIQAFHAFAFSFMFEAICQGGHVIERIAVIYAIFPITEFARNILFQGAGGNTVAMGQRMGDAAKNTVKAVGGAVAGAAVGGIATSAAGVATGGNMGAAAKITGGGGFGGGGGGKGGALSSLGAAGSALQKLDAKPGASKEDVAAVSAAQGHGAKLSAIAGVAGGVVNAVGGLDSMMSGMARGDDNAIRSGVDKIGTAAGMPVRAAADHANLTPNFNSSRKWRTAGYSQSKAKDGIDRSKVTE